MIKRLCIIASDYPSPQRAVNTFVDQLVCQFADFGIDCTVISPQSMTKVIIGRYSKSPYYRERVTPGGNVIKVFAPKYVSASAYKMGIFNTTVIALKTFIGAVSGLFDKLHRQNPFNAVYGHFIFPSGIVANCISKNYNIPAFFAYGENTNYTIDYLGVEKTRELLTFIRGVVSVSTANKQNLIRQQIVSEDIISVFPNSIDHKLFYCRDKKEMRKKYGLPEDAFIIAFVGRFVDIKGPNRLSQAIKKIGPEKVKSIFIGDGEVKPTCEGILIQGPQSHDKIPELLSAADVFVLPTLAEGCCNAIIEAMACGLPVVSSKMPFNDDILDDTCSIRINPNDINEIAEAIELLLTDCKFRVNLAEGAIKKAQKLNIRNRAKNITEFMDSKIRG